MFLLSLWSRFHLVNAAKSVNILIILITYDFMNECAKFPIINLFLISLNNTHLMNM